MKRWIALLMILALTVTGLAGCKNANTNEESAAAGEYIEGGAEQEETGKGPVKVENQTTDDDDDYVDSGNEPTDQPSTDQPSGEGTNDKPSTDQPSGEGTTDTPDTPSTDGTGDDEEKVNYKEGNKLKIMAYNLRCGNDENGRSIAERAKRFRVVMEKYKPDVCGFSEVVPEWMDNLTADYPEYNHYLKYRAASSQEGTPVFWNTKVLQKVEEGHFWLSPTPDRESKAEAWGASHYRIVNWAKLKVLATGSEFIFFSTHFDFTPEAHINSAKTILQKAKAMGAFSKYPIFCVGDYNMNPWSKGYNAMVDGYLFADINYELDNISQGTSYGYHKTESGGIIDFIFYSYEKVHPLHYEVIDMEIEGNYVSDHQGLYAEAALLN